MSCFVKTYTKTHCITPDWLETTFFDLYASELRTKIHFSKSDDLSFLSNVLQLAFVEVSLSIIFYMYMY